MHNAHSSVPIRPTTVQMPNLALMETKRINVHGFHCIASGIKSVCFVGAEERSTLHVAAHNCAQDAATWLKRHTDVYRDYVCLIITVDNEAIAGRGKN